MTEGVDKQISECQSGRAKPLRLDPKRYQPYLDEMQVSEAEAQELLETLWTMMRAFVDIGFGLDSVQIFTEHITAQLGKIDSEFQSAAEIRPLGLIKPERDDHE